MAIESGAYVFFCGIYACYAGLQADFNAVVDVYPGTCGAGHAHALQVVVGFFSVGNVGVDL